MPWSPPEDERAEDTIEAWIQGLRVVDLRQVSKWLGISTRGNKADLKNQIIARITPRPNYAEKNRSHEEARLEHWKNSSKFEDFTFDSDTPYPLDFEQNARYWKYDIEKKSWLSAPTFRGDGGFQYEGNWRREPSGPNYQITPTVLGNQHTSSQNRQQEAAARQTRLEGVVEESAPGGISETQSKSQVHSGPEVVVTRDRIRGGGLTLPKFFDKPNGDGRNLPALLSWFACSAVLFIILNNLLGMPVELSALSALVQCSFVPLLWIELCKRDSPLRPRDGIAALPLLPVLLLIGLIVIGWFGNETGSTWSYIYTGELVDVYGSTNLVSSIGLLIFLPLLFMQFEAFSHDQKRSKEMWGHPRGTRLATSWPITLLCIFLIFVHVWQGPEIEQQFVIQLSAQLSMIAAIILWIGHPSTNLFRTLLSLMSILMPILFWSKSFDDVFSVFTILGPPLSLLVAGYIGHLAKIGKLRSGPKFYSLILLVIITLTFGERLTTENTETMVFTILLIVFSWILIELSWIGEYGRPQLHIRKILNDSGRVSLTERSAMQIAVLGSRKSGKSTFLGALYTLLRNAENRDLWYGTSLALQENRTLPQYRFDEIRELVPEEEADNFKLLKNFINQRNFATMMRDEIDSGKIEPTPGPSRSNGGKGRFPFTLDGDPKTTQFLNQFMTKITNPDPNIRDNLDATQKVAGGLSLDLSFKVRSVRKVGTMLSPITRNFSWANKKFSIGIGTSDTPGEDVRKALSFFAGHHTLFEHEVQTTKQLLERIRRIHSQEFIHSEHSDIKLFEEAEVNHRLNILDMMLQSDCLVYLMDVDTLTHPQRTSEQQEEKQSATDFLRITRSLSKLQGCNLNSVICLLNKGDRILHENEGEDATARSDVSMVPGNWVELQNSGAAEQMLNELTNYALQELIEDSDVNYVKCYFAATLGGKVNLKDRDVNTQDPGYPAYPMIPFNVIEPLLKMIVNNPHRLR